MGVVATSSSTLPLSNFRAETPPVGHQMVNIKLQETEKLEHFFQGIYNFQKLRNKILSTQLSKSDGINVSNLRTSAWQQRSIGRSNLAIDFESY